MGQLDEASRRLDAALDRLERALAARAGDSKQDLSEALKAAQRENAALQKIAGTVASRLDATIARLKASLEA